MSLLDLGLDAENDAVAELVELLCGMYPEADRQGVSELVQAHWAEYDGAAIRDYIPVLVTHSARDVLSQSNPVNG